jgi:hypothetical protein
MAQEAVGLGTWDSLSAQQRADLVAKEVWRYEVQERMAREARGEVDSGNDAEVEDEDLDDEAARSTTGKKAKKRSNKKRDKKDR